MDMLFDFDRLRARVSALDLAPRSLEQRQRDVYDSHRHRVFSISFYMTGSELEAEEILRGTFVCAFRRAEEPDGALVDAALVEQLREHLILEDEDLPLPLNSCLPGARNILRTDLEEAIRCLPPVERLIFLLMDVEGCSARHVADLLQRSEAAVLRASVVARLRLRAELAAQRADGKQAA
jgi:RNA polymerase sigma-70 factor (ECF subfamily)